MCPGKARSHVRSWVVLGGLGAILGRSWVVLGHLGWSWAVLGGLGWFATDRWGSAWPGVGQVQMFKIRACRVLDSRDVFSQQIREMFWELTCGIFIAMCSMFALHPPKDRLQKRHVNKRHVNFLEFCVQETRRPVSNTSPGWPASAASC
jgi:hypothetical protein